MQTCKGLSKERALNDKIMFCDGILLNYLTLHIEIFCFYTNSLNERSEDYKSRYCDGTQLVELQILKLARKVLFRGLNNHTRVVLFNDQRKDCEE